MRSRELSCLGIKKWRLQWKDTRLCLVKTTWPDAFLAQMEPQKIRSHASDAQEQVHLRPTDTDGRLQRRRHIYLEHDPPHLVPLLELNISKSSNCRPVMRIHLLLFPLLNHLPSIPVPRIASTIQHLIQICCLMQEHPLVSPLSAVWYCI